MPRKHQLVSVGSIFSVPLGDGTYSLGQVITDEPEAMNTFLCALYDLRLQESSDLGASIKSLDSQQPIAIQLVTKELFKSGVWSVVGESKPAHVDQYVELAELRRRGFVGAKILGAGVVRLFLMAYYGLHPWNGMADPAYFDRLLINGKRPQNAVFVRKN